MCVLMCGTRLQEVRSVYDREKDALPYALTIRPNTTAESQERRKQR
jgi:hypothetical protein